MSVFVQFDNDRAVAAGLYAAEDAPEGWLEAPEGAIVGDMFKLVSGECELMTEDEIAAFLVEEEEAAEATRNRGIRDGLLAQTDWQVIKALEAGTTVPANVVTYRQKLRDITAHTEWPLLDELDWPTL